MASGLGGKSPSNIATFLTGIDFPCSKSDLVNHARNNNAPNEVLDVLNNMPNMTYNSMADVMSGVGEVE